MLWYTFEYVSLFTSSFMSCILFIYILFYVASHSFYIDTGAGCDQTLVDVVVDDDDDDDDGGNDKYFGSFFCFRFFFTSFAWLATFI